MTGVSSGAMCELATCFVDSKAQSELILTGPVIEAHAISI